MMIFSKIKALVRKCWIFYLLGFIVVFGIKLFYSKADSNDLIWILTPTAWWVRILSGITFEYVPYVGFMNHSFRFIIAPSCSGVQFMMITIATLIYSFIHRMKTKRGGFYWIALSLCFSYLFTIFVNGIRIVLSIYLPLYLNKSKIYNEWMNAERFHTMIGIVVYFTFLFTVYHIAGYVSLKFGNQFEVKPDSAYLTYPGKSFIQLIGNCMPPVFCYFSIVLLIPFLNRAYINNFENFIEYALLMAGVCLTIIFLFLIMEAIRKYFGKLRKSRHNLP